MRLGFDYLSRGPNCAQSVMRAYWAVVDGARLGTDGCYGAASGDEQTWSVAHLAGGVSVSW